MTPYLEILLPLASLGFGVSLLAETTSWTLRAMSTRSNSGFFNARANIYLYAGRFFALLFMMILSLIVDKGADLHRVLNFVAIAVSFATLIQCAYWYSELFFQAINRLIIFLFLRKNTSIKILINRGKVDHRLFFNSWVATSILVFGVTSPYILASIYPDIRMSISTIGQLINAFGTVILLFKVEPLLYKRMDKSDLHIYVFSYIKGRCFGLLFASSILWALFLILP